MNNISALTSCSNRRLPGFLSRSVQVLTIFSGKCADLKWWLLKCKQNLSRMALKGGTNTSLTRSHNLPRLRFAHGAFSVGPKGLWQKLRMWCSYFKSFSLCLNAPTMHHQKKIYVTFECWVFMVNMTKVSNNEVSVCSPCDAAARPADCSQHTVWVFSWGGAYGRYGHLRHRKHHMVTISPWRLKVDTFLTLTSLFQTSCSIGGALELVQYEALEQKCKFTQKCGFFFWGFFAVFWRQKL